MSIFKSNVFPELQTKRLTLRPPSANDAPSYHEILSIPETSQFSDIPTNPTRKESSAFVMRMKKLHTRGNGVAWIIETKQTHTVIGSLRISALEKKIQCGIIAYELHPEHWRQGYATEALQVVVKHAHDVMNLNRLEARVIGDNKASDSVLTKNGFVFEGEMRHKAWFQEQFWDVRLYARLATD